MVAILVNIHLRFMTVLSTFYPVLLPFRALLIKSVFRKLGVSCVYCLSDNGENCSSGIFNVSFLYHYKLI